MNISEYLRKDVGLAALGVCLTAAAIAPAGAQNHGEARPRVEVDADGTVRLPPFAVPQSAFLSPEAKAMMTRQALAGGWPMPTGPLTAPGVMAKWRQAMDEQIFTPAQRKQQARYAVTIESKTIGGVRTDIVLPRAGIAAQNEHRVLVNLHSGGFQMGAGDAALAESIPIAAVARIRVVSVDYRMWPEHRFPAASEDVAAVYRELIKKYKPQNIGLFGCSAGGSLAAQSVAWFQKQGLPRPGAIGIFCSSAGNLGGDSAYLAPPLNGQAVVPIAPAGPQRMGYFAGTDPHDPLVAPVSSPEVLAKFPPTLLITGTRDMAMSGALLTHEQLVKAGVDARLHVWEGLGHGFFYDPDPPESRDAYEVITKFFLERLGQ